MEFDERLPHLPTFTHEQLASFNGSEESGGKRYIGIRNHVFDITESPYYGPKGPYRRLASNDISVPIARGGFNDEFYNVTKYHWRKSLNLDELKSMQGWFEFYYGKYKLVGYLVDPPNLDEIEPR